MRRPDETPSCGDGTSQRESLPSLSRPGCGSAAGRALIEGSCPESATAEQRLATGILVADPPRSDAAIASSPPRFPTMPFSPPGSRRNRRSCCWRESANTSALGARRWWCWCRLAPTWGWRRWGMCRRTGVPHPTQESSTCYDGKLWNRIAFSHVSPFRHRPRYASTRFDSSPRDGDSEPLSCCLVGVTGLLISIK